MGTETSGLPSRYEIRVLGPEHTDWASAIVSHSNAFLSPVWPLIFPNEKTKGCLQIFKAADYLVRHQIESGLSLGLFDTEYQYKRPESAAAGGRLYWDLEDTDADEERLLGEMDFPLLSIALAYDSFHKLDPAGIATVVEALPQYAYVFAGIGALDKRDPATWEATAPGQVIFRNATATRGDANGKGFMSALARHMMRMVADAGFRGIQIECLADAVNYVWSKPPAPFRGEVVASFNAWDYEAKSEGEDGEFTYPFRPSRQEISRVYVTLA